MNTKKFYTKELGSAVARQASTGKAGVYHIIPGVGPKWRLVPSGKARALRVFPTQEAAISFIKSHPQLDCSELVIHATSGLVVERKKLREHAA